MYTNNPSMWADSRLTTVWGHNKHAGTATLLFKSRDGLWTPPTRTSRMAEVELPPSASKYFLSDTFMITAFALKSHAENSDDEGAPPEPPGGDGVTAKAQDSDSSSSSDAGDKPDTCPLDELFSDDDDDSPSKSHDGQAFAAAIAGADPVAQEALQLAISTAARVLLQKCADAPFSVRSDPPGVP